MPKNVQSSTVSGDKDTLRALLSRAFIICRHHQTLTCLKLSNKGLLKAGASAYLPALLELQLSNIYMRRSWLNTFAACVPSMTLPQIEICSLPSFLEDPLDKVSNLR